MYEICLKFTTNTLERSHWHSSGFFTVNFKQISHCSGTSNADFEQVNAGWILTEMRNDLKQIEIFFENFRKN